MHDVTAVLDILFQWAPAPAAWERDNIGLLLGSRSAAVRGILVALDVTLPVVEEAIALGANVIVAHHPVIFHPLRSIMTDGAHGATIRAALRNDIAIIAMHTNADAAAEGLNTALAAQLELKDARALEPSVAAPGHCMGAIGVLDPPMTTEAFLLHVKNRLGIASLRCTPHDPAATIRTVAVCGGAGSGYASAAIAAGADAFVTADLSYHAYQDARGLLLLIDAGHYETEKIFIDTCAEVLRRSLFKSSEKSPIFPSVTNTNAMVIV